jgi:hypothetical protein
VLSAVFLMRLLHRRLPRVALLLCLPQLRERVHERLACVSQLLMRCSRAPRAESRAWPLLPSGGPRLVRLLKPPVRRIVRRSELFP